MSAVRRFGGKVCWVDRPESRSEPRNLAEFLKRRTKRQKRPYECLLRVFPPDGGLEAPRKALCLGTNGDRQGIRQPYLKRTEARHVDTPLDMDDGPGEGRIGGDR